MEQQTKETGYVYKYVDTRDGIVKYVGLVNPGNSLMQRVRQHENDIWYHDDFDIYYIEVNTKTDCEFLESHFIQYYKSYKYYNKAKTHWGESSYIDGEEFHWKKYYKNTKVKIKSIGSKGLNSMLFAQKMCEDVNNIIFHNKIKNYEIVFCNNEKTPWALDNTFLYNNGVAYKKIRLNETDARCNHKRLFETIIYQFAFLIAEKDGVVASNRGIYVNKHFKKYFHKYGIKYYNKNAGYGYEPCGVKYKIKDICRWYDPKKFNLEEYGVIGSNGKIKKQKSSTRKYICPCCGTSFRATKNINVLCMDCNVQFVLA